MPSHESTLRGTVVEALAPLDAVSVENPVLPGTPDVNYVEGWLELKSLPGWPADPSTPLRVEHWTPQQKVWHVRRSRAGGTTHVLLEVVRSRHFLLLDGAVAARILGKATRAELVAAAVDVWNGRAAMKAGLLLRLSAPLPR